MVESEIELIKHFNRGQKLKRKFGYKNETKQLFFSKQLQIKLQISLIITTMKEPPPAHPINRQIYRY